MLTRVPERVFFDIFKSVSNGANRIPLKAGLNALNSFFNSPENPYRVHMGNDSSDFKLSSEDFMDQFYSRHVDKRHGLRSQILMVGGPKNLRGNPRGPTDAMLSFPQDMECIFLEKIIPGSCASQIKASYTMKELQEIQLKENRRCLETLKPPG